MEKDKTTKRYQGVSTCVEGTLLNRMAREGLSEKVTFEQIPKECKRALG